MNVIFIMKLYLQLLFICLVQLTRAENNCSTNEPLVLSGHYITWPSKEVHDKFVKDKLYIPNNIIYTRFHLCSDRVFLAAPRLKSGVPFSLGFASLNNQNRCYTYVKPFPCIETFDTKLNNNGVLVNVIDLVMGEDGLIWVLDSGISETLNDRFLIEGEPKVVGIDETTGKFRHTIHLQSLIYPGKSRLQFMVVEHVNDVKTMVYIGDGGTRSIIVWDVQGQEGYRVKLPHSTIVGCKENLYNDVFYLALVESNNGNYIYFTYLMSQDLIRVRTRDLHIRMNSRCTVNILGKKPNKMVFLGVGYGSILYFRYKGGNHLYSWDSKMSFLEENFMIVWKNKDCRSVTHVDVDSEGILWILESNMQDFITDHVGNYGPSILLTPITEAPIPISTEFEIKDGLDDE